MQVSQSGPVLAASAAYKHLRLTANTELSTQRHLHHEHGDFRLDPALLKCMIPTCCSEAPAVEGTQAAKSHCPEQHIREHN